MLGGDGLEVLSEEECRTLLAQSEIGRVALTSEALPSILPVNFGLLDGDIVFMTGAGMKLRAALDHTVVAFEVDDFDRQNKRGWSVVAVGVVREVTDEHDLTRVRALDVQPWAPGDRQHCVRLRPEFLTGRRIDHEKLS